MAPSPVDEPGGTRMVEIPDDLRAFLAARKRLQYDADECEPGRIRLLPLTKLAAGQVWVNARPANDLG